MYRYLLVLLLLPVMLLASVRGKPARVDLHTSENSLSPGQSFRVLLDPSADGFVYVYSLDGRGYVSLLYPTLPEDGRGEVQAGQLVVLDPVYAGQESGKETLVAVHTLEYRPIRSSRHEFLAPDPGDLQDVNARLTRVDKELDVYSTWQIEIIGPPAAEEQVGIVIHDHVYDYWCPYCGCWHPRCTHNHCYCGWEVVGYYHSHYHYGHCFLWGHPHYGWHPPLFYSYAPGGSDWDYDTSIPREESPEVWERYHGFSEQWRTADREEIDPASWIDPPKREGPPHPDEADIRSAISRVTWNGPLPDGVSQWNTDRGYEPSPLNAVQPRPVEERSTRSRQVQVAPRVTTQPAAPAVAAPDQKLPQVTPAPPKAEEAPKTKPKAPTSRSKRTRTTGSDDKKK